MGVLIEQNSALRQQNSHLFEELDTLRLEIAQQQINYDQLIQKTLCNLSTTNHELANQLNHCQQESNNLQKEYNHVTQTLNNLQKEYDDIKKQLNNLQKQNDRDTEGK
ncbi:unnamed protein product [Rotaria sordida]|uniref:Uncharacterized protein n=1 Tax=Rotaria sordida TaxID=392033 RepID=A0A819M132_9BILA|nr:unnamed protein product [Rotaria sordida]